MKMRKIIAIVAAVLMLFSIMPMAVFAADTYELVTNVDDLAVGDKIIIFAVNDNAVLSTTQNGNNRGKTDATPNGTAITLTDAMQVITVEAGLTEGTYAFNVGNGYLYAASSSKNYLRTETTLTANSSWTITIAADGVATVKSSGSYTRNWMRYNSQSSLFSCYASGQNDIAIYKLNSGSEEPPVEECEHDWADATCTTPKTCSKCGATDGAALGHSYGEATETVAPDCTTAGEKQSTCTVCGDVKTETIDALGHNFVDGTCSACGAELSQKVDKIDDVANLTAGTYYLAGYATGYVNGTTVEDWSSYPWHVWIGSVYSGDLETTPYYYSESNGGFGIASTDPTTVSGALIELQAVEGKADTYYIVCNAKYLASTENATSRRLALVTEPTEWVATANANGGITLSSNGVYLGTGDAASRLVRAYKAESTLKYGVVLFSFDNDASDCEHSWNAATCTEPATCALCGAKNGEALGHTYDSDADTDCNVCGEVREAETTDGYILLTSLNIGDTVTLVAESASKELGGISNTSTQYGLGVDYSGAPVGAYPLTVEAGYNDSTYSFKTGDGEYLCWTSGNSLKVTSTKDATSSWTVTFEGNNVMIVNASDTTRKIRWNASSPRFATYTSAQTDIQLYGISASDDSECKHVYDNTCDTDCNLCGEIRVAGHAWDSCADADCNNGCGHIRETVDCVYTSAYDTTCSKCGTARTVELPAADSELTIPEANDVAMLGGSKYTTDKYYVTGTVESITGTEYGNLYIQDENGNKLYVYGVYGPDGTTRFDALGDLQPAVGDEITLYGQLGTYSGSGQMKNGWLIVETTVCDECTYSGDYDPTCNVCYTEREITLPEADTELSFEKIEEIAAGRDHNDFTDSKYYVIGTITEVYNETYGNMYIEDEAGNSLTIYGTYSADGSTRYDSMETKPVAGDKVKLYGIIGNFNGTAQMKDAWIIEVIVPCAHEYDNDCDVDCNLCGETREVTHNVVHVEAKAATCTAEGNIEYWYCDVCGMAWLDAECILNTNLKAVVLPIEHTYDDEYDAVCNVCGETRDVPEKPVEDVLYGDVNSDGGIDSLDAILLQQYLAGWEVELDFADVNGDGGVDSLDAILLQQYLAGWEVELGPKKVFNDGEFGAW